MAKSREIKINCALNKTKLLSKNNNKIVKILKRDEFLAISSKFRVRTKGLNLQARKRSSEEISSIRNLIRVGFTCSKNLEYELRG